MSTPSSKPFYQRKSFIGGISLLVVALIIIPQLWSFNKTSGGQVAVVRNGGPFDNNRVRQVVQPSSSLVWTGLFSHIHNYPSQQRFYTISSSGTGDLGTNDVVQVPSSDGVQVGIEGTLYFNLNTDDSTLRTFDNKYGTRTFTIAGDSSARFPWQGDKGWLGFLNQIVRPVIDNDLREQINNFTCTQLISSCALVQNGAVAQGAAAGVSATVPQSNNGNIAAVQNAINASLNTDLSNTLGGPFLTGIKFNLVKVTLPADIQKGITDAQAAYANVSKAQADVESAHQEALANQQRQQGYQNCPACAQIDMLKSIPQNVTVYAPGASSAVPLTGAK